VLLTLPLAGCGGDDATTTNPVVAVGDLGEGVRLEIVDLDESTYLVSQTGPQTASPRHIDAASPEAGDPVALFKKLTGKDQVPAGLLTMARAPANATLERDSIEPLLVESSATESVGSVSSALTTASNWTGTGACSSTWFVNAGFCPGNGPNSTCRADVNWAFIEHNNAAGGDGTVCANSGQLTYRITRNGVTEFTVDQGSWRSAIILTKGSCGWFTCSTQRDYTRFEIVNRPDGAFGHLGATINP
jgi:hypothetical protein